MEPCSNEELNLVKVPHIYTWENFDTVVKHDRKPYGLIPFNLKKTLFRVIKTVQLFLRTHTTLKSYSFWVLA